MSKHAELIQRLEDLSNLDESIDCDLMREAAQALEAQAREIAELKAQEAELCTLYGLAQAECKKMRKDAERYRLLRECGVDSYEACGSGDKLDAECDAAIAMKGQP